MKRIILFFALALATSAQMRADEGMWTLMNLPQAVYETMVAEGYELDQSKLYTADDAICKAVVNFGGFCSGVVVSPDGLVFTNHHCGFDAIRRHSTVENDYMRDGFYAKTLADELPNDDLFVSFMIAQKDITDQVEEYDFRSLSHDEQQEVLDAIEQLENKRIKLTSPTLHAELKPYYEANKYYIDIYQDFNDVRLVFAIPKSMGKFGGETDNWMWPRQTCDFSVFRIYADPATNGPAEYSEANVPYHPTRWAQVSLEGYKEGDFAMTMGYPGSTERYLSSFGIREMRDAQNTPRWQTREVKQKVMRKHMDADQAVRIKYDSKYARSSNYWKNAIGMNKCIDSLDIIGLKQRHEAAIQAYVDSTGYLADKLNMAKLDSLYGERFAAMKGLMLFRETFTVDEVTRRAQGYAPDDEYDVETDKDMLTVLLANYDAKADDRYKPAFFADINGDYSAFVDKLYKKKKLQSSYGQQLKDMNKLLRDDLKAVRDDIDEQERYLCAAKVRMEEDMPHYSDANFTLRLSYGQVGGFDQHGAPSGYFTSPASIYAKMLQGDSNSDYKTEPVMHELFSAEQFGRYSDATSGTMNLCFLTNNDITGGNSGSPVFNGKNELIGLAFDGNWESLSGDIFFDDNLARCICVDIRYVLFMIDCWGGAERLIDELGVE